MKSPKFRLRQDDLAFVVSEANVKATWRHVVRAAMRRQYIEDPVEFLDINLKLNSVASGIVSTIKNGEYVPNRPKRILVEKSKGLCRQVVVPHPYDCLVLQCLSNSLFPFLKKKAPHRNAFYEPERGFNNKDRSGYGALHSWLNFQKEILTFSQTRRFVIVTDIANYYDGVSYSHLRNVLSNHLPDEKEALLDLTLHVLGSMLWQPDYMPRTEIGLPQIDLDAPRLLAHTFLFELDKYMSTGPGIDYARYMDDIDVGVDTLAQAKGTLRDIDLILHSRQVRLNSGKTKILQGREIGNHFKVRENLILDLLISRIERRPNDIMAHRKSILRTIATWLRKGVFDSGNGEKILKRLINLAAKVDCSLPGALLMQILYLRPNLREEVFRYARRVSGGARYLKDFLGFIRDPVVVDDASALLFAYAVVEMNIPRVLAERKNLAKTAVWMLKHERCDVWAYSALWILSKYGTQKQIFDAIVASYSFWRSDYVLGRLVAALDCFIKQKDKNLYRGLLSSSRNVGSAEVTSFLDEIYQDPKSTTGIFSILKANNTSLPNKLTHAKWIVLLHVLGSPVVPQKSKDLLRKVHSQALRDHYYQARVRALF